MVLIEEPIEFEWDRGNQDKNWIKHEVNIEECEQVFFDKHKKTFPDKLHAGGEERFRVVGMTDNSRLLLIVFTIRKGKVRVISARDINRKERSLYEEKT